MSVKIVIPTKDGLVLHTKKKFVEDDIQLVLDEKLFPSGTVVITENGTHDVEKYTTAEINVDPRKPEQSKEVEYSENGQYVVSPEEGYVLTDVKVAVNVPIPEGYVKPEGDKEITENGQYDVSTYQTATVNIDTKLPEQEKEIEIIENGKSEIIPDDGFVLNKVIVDVQVPDIPAKLQDKTATPTKEAQEIAADNEFDGLGKVAINPIPDEYIVPEGSIDITNTEEYNVTNYATAQIKDGNLKPENIAEGITILGLTGNFKGGGGADTSDATATNDDLLLGKTAYANGQKLVGTIEDYDYSTSLEVRPEIDAFVTRTFTSYTNERVKSVGYRLFYMYVELKEVSFPNAETIEQYAFYGCNGLTEVSFPKATMVDTNAFNACTKLKVAKLPLLEKVVEIFRNDTSLEVVYLPKATSFSGGVFADDVNLKALILDSDTVANLQSTNSFVRSGIANGTGYVYVRDNLVNSYKTATNWSTYADQIKPLSEYVEVE